MKQFDHSKIKEFREAADLSQDKLATIMSTEEDRIWTQQISEWERGGRSLTVKSLSKLCEALGKTTDDFFVDDNDK
jgi:transcriptional regulator with XRE-family HTH domain